MLPHHKAKLVNHVKKPCLKCRRPTWTDREHRLCEKCRIENEELPPRARPLHWGHTEGENVNWKETREQ